MSRVSAEVGSAANSYEILAKLAMGGMAEIFLARGASTAGVERYVVLKRVLRHRATEEGFIKMFLDEARLAAQLQHPNIAQVYDIGKLGDSYFFTMEYVHGETVRTLLQRSHALRRPIPIGSVLTVIAGAAAGLHHAHERKGMDGKHLGIVHRDVSPSNLMVSYEGTVKVVDFGVAKAAHRDTETRSGTVKGKITYMSPEQCKGGDIDRRSDLFSLGIVMWEMLTTERLFRRNSDFENMQAIVSEEVPRPSQYRPEISPEIDSIVMKLLAKRVADRFQNADDVHEALENAAVRTQSSLSTASLGRFMRELFGQRPEPWIELQSHESHPEAYTVTSDPLVAELMPDPDDELDQKLAQMPQLSQRMTAQEAPFSPPTDRPIQPTVPFRVQAEKLAIAQRQSGSIAQLPATAPPQGVPHHPGTPAGGVPQRPSTPQSFPTLPMPATGLPPANAPHSPPLGMQSYTPSQSAQLGLGSAPMRPHTPSFTPGSSPQYPVMQQGAGSHYSGVGPGLPARAPQRSRAFIILIPACIVGIIIGIVVAVGGEDKPTEESAKTVSLTEQPGEQPADKPAEEPTGSAAPGSGSASDNAAGVAPTKPDDPPVKTVPEVNPKPDTQEPKPDTQEPKPDTQEPKPDTQDPKPDPKQKTGGDKTGTDKTTKRPPPQQPPADVAALYRAGKYKDVVEQCNSSPKIVALNSTVCTVAACKAKETAKAKKWLPSVGAAKRASVIRDCGGVLPAEKAPSGDDACKRDPLACQH